jgi:hypothetical protein
MAQRPRQARIQFQSQFRSPGVDTSGAEVMRQLAGLGRTVGQIAETVGRPMVEQEMAEMGAKAAETAGTIDPNTGALVAPPEFKKFGWGSQQYNNAVRAGYESNLSTSISNIIADAEVEHSDDIEAYNNSVQGSLKGLMATVPDEYKGSVNNMIARVGGKASRNIAERQRVKILEETANSVITEADRKEKELLQSARDAEDTSELYGQYVVSLTNLADQGGIDPVTAQAKIDGLAEKMVIEGVIGEFNRAITAEGDPKSQAFNARAVVEELRENPDKRLTPAQNDALLNKLDVQVSALESANATAAAKLTSDEMIELSDLDILIDSQAIPSADLVAKVYDLFDRGVIKTADGISSRINKINKGLRDGVRKEAGIAAVANQVAGQELPEDQRSLVLNQQDVDNYYEVASPNLSDNDDIRSAQQTGIVVRTGYVPTELRTEIRNGLVSQDPAQVEYAVETIQRIQEVPGIGESAFSDSEVAFASQVASLAEYLPMDQAIQEARNITATGRPQQKAMVEARTAQIKDEKDVFANAYDDELADNFTAWQFRSESDFKEQGAFAQMSKDYGRLVEQFYKAGMVDVESAKAKAMRLIKANWSEGEFGLMKYSPERFPAYKLTKTEDTSYIRYQIQEDLAAGGLEVAAENIFLEADAETARTASTGKPSYRVKVRTEDGTLMAVDLINPDGSTSSRFVPDPEQGNKDQKAREKAASEAKLTPYGKLKYDSRSTLNKEEQNALAVTLRNSNNPFAIIGRSVDAVASLPSKVTRQNVEKLIRMTGMPTLTNKVGEAYYYVVDAVGQASDDYVASLSKGKSK